MRRKRWPWQKKQTPHPDLFAIFDAIDAYEMLTWKLCEKAMEHDNPDHPERAALRREWTTKRRDLNDLIREGMHR